MRTVSSLILLASGFFLAVGGAVSLSASPDLRVIVGVYFKVDDDYILQDQELVFDVGVPCYTWHRTSGPHEGDDPRDEPHEHYNAADETSYIKETFRWTEYGPEHDEKAVKKRCEDGREGEEGKWVNWTDYFPEAHGDNDPYYLKIKDVVER